MKVEELIIDGFKSYATRTVIADWDPQFNAITGLNGSGKSNILDAICFVLGISSMTIVRASNLQDLIYKRGQAGVTKASVTIVFDNSDKTNSPIGFNNSSKISVTRQIILGGTSKYLINGHRAPQQSVLQLFQSVQLNINNPNFLIMQGKITKVLNMKPNEILSLIEEAAGTKMFENRREKAERTMAKKETKLQESRTLLEEEIEPKLEKLRNEKRMFLEFQTTQADFEKTMKVVHAFDYKNMINRHASVKDVLESSEARMAELKGLILRTAEEIGSLNEDLEQVKIQKEKELDKDATLSRLEKEESELLNEVSRIKTSHSICNDNIKENNKQVEKLKSDIEQFKLTLKEKSETFESTEKEYQEINASLAKIKETYSKKEELLSTLLTGITSTGDTDGGYSAQLTIAKNKLNDTEVSIKKLSMRIDILNKELVNNQPKLQQAKIENEKIRGNVEKHKHVCLDLEQQLSKSGFDPLRTKELKTRENSLRQEIHRVETQNENLKRRVAGLDFNYTNPSENFDARSVKGVAAQLFTLNKDHFDAASALQVCAGGRLYNVVVDNEKTASLLLEKGRLRKRVTIIPLNKIAARTLNARTLQMAKDIAPGKVELALNLIGYDDEVSRAMEFIFGGSLVCQDANTAKKVTFHPQIRTRSITLDGDVYDPEGTLSGGSRNNTNNLLINIQTYNESCQTLKKLRYELDDIVSLLRAQEATSQKTKLLQNNLNLAQHKLHLAQRALEDNSATQIIRRNEELHKEIETCHSDITSQQSTVRDYEMEIERIKKDMNEFDQNKGAKLQELKDGLQKMAEKITKQEQMADVKSELYQNIQLETEQLESDISANETAIEQVITALTTLEEERQQTEKKLDNLNAEISTVQTKLNEEKRRLLDIDDELRELENLIKEKNENKANWELEQQRLTHELDKNKSNTNSLQKRISDLLTEQEWLRDNDLVEGIIQENRGVNLAEYRERGNQLEEKFHEMRRKINPNIMSMIENVEKKESALKVMIRTIEKDKVKIQETISKLNEYKRDTLIKTWEKVTEDFGHIFADLLPNSFAKLVPSEGKDVTEGLEVRVKLGNLWKDSLVELSGGQRSLVALSLIMALLQFRPAPMYILDEVDAALDLSHTQNIGHLIKTRFKGSQFIVVSLKEGMFSNANRVFRTRFQNGTSVVSII
ncbi:hypothetical protein NCAS_0E01920 [Naumovozyma castellii]|uniref:Structural maintenance of chromosomes protein n=1 Tax=Naumovozyma castellii TaxID=27288 RepID=G0VFJ6_NAUCA|nr:hypothetical protein NCAS_0E01920 [Naumovozyma castellii CBS 4309]CCC70262.1 hypothetical protein NCAS_0E01920 [Naumovozyma castellii CBS 4309]